MSIAISCAQAAFDTWTLARSVSSSSPVLFSYRCDLHVGTYDSFAVLRRAASQPGGPGSTSDGRIGCAQTRVDLGDPISFATRMHDLEPQSLCRLYVTRVIIHE